MTKPKVRELGEAIRSLVSRPFTDDFPRVRTEPPDGFRGKPAFDTEDCVGCATCQQECPAGAIELTDDVPAGIRTLAIHLDVCIFCGQCQRHCITESGIRLSKEYDLATLDREELEERIEKRLQLCEMCGSVVGTVDHVRWVAHRLGPAAYSNPTLMLAALNELELTGDAFAPQPDAVLRGDRIRVLCPQCRRATTLDGS